MTKELAPNVGGCRCLYTRVAEKASSRLLGGYEGTKESRGGWTPALPSSSADLPTGSYDQQSRNHAPHCQPQNPQNHPSSNSHSQSSLKLLVKKS